MDAASRFAESRVGIAHENFKAMSYLQTVIEVQKDTDMQTALDYFFKYK